MPDNPEAAAIAGNEAGHIYNLQVVAQSIEDFSRNVTRFLVIGLNDTPRTGNDKTSIMFVTAHAPGALYKVMQPIAEADLNMMKLESRPSKYENWSYFFFAAARISRFSKTVFSYPFKPTDTMT